MLRRCTGILLVLLLMASTMPPGQAAQGLQVDSYIALGPVVQVTVSNSVTTSQTGQLVVMVELANGLSDISVQTVTVDGMGSVSKSSIFPVQVSRIIFVGISEGPDPVNNIARY